VTVTVAVVVVVGPWCFTKKERNTERTDRQDYLILERCWREGERVSEGGREGAVRAWEGGMEEGVIKIISFRSEG
jgi:hypothetical protein